MAGARRLRHQYARWAGVCYVLVVATGTFSLGVVPSIVFANDTPLALVEAVVAHERLLSASIAVEAACYVAFGCLALTLHALLRDVHTGAAALMAMLVLSSVSVGFSNLIALVEIQRLVEAGEAATSADAIANAFGRYRAGIFLQSVPWGLWLLPLGYLTIRSGFLPPLLGVGLILAGAGYIAHFIARLMIDGYRDSVWPDVFSAPRVAEIIMALWLLACGARRTPWGARPA
jgi:hypothetical protein